MRVHAAIAFCVVMLALMFAYPVWLSQTADLTPDVPADEAQIALKTIDAVQRRDFKEAVALREPQYKPPSDAQYEKMAQQFPRAEPIRRYVIRYAQNLPHTAANETLSSVTLRYDYADGEAQEFAFDIVRGRDYLNVSDQHFVHLSPQQAHRYDFDVQSWMHDPWRGGPLALAILLDLFVFVTFCICFAGPGPRWRWRWLWLIAILIGLVRISYNLSDTSFFLFPAAFVIPPAGLFRASLTGPWGVWVSVPFGAGAYWLMRGWLNGNVARGAIDITSGSWRSKVEIE
jgi:hypothetical protein